MDQFLMNATTCASATLITHPIELVKTRMQTQGELTRSYTRTYSGTAQSLMLVARSDGFFALWKGISAGLMYQIFMNGTRLTLFDQMKRHTSVPVAGITAGLVSGALASPFYLLKTQQQILSSVQVGNQHRESDVKMVRFFSEQMKKNGIRGLYRGATSQLLRVAVGSGAQLTSFETSKQLMSSNLPNSHWFVVTASSACIASVFVCLFMSPFDVAATRVYNQPLDQFGRGTLYNGPIDAMLKIWRNEGASAYLKGLRAGYPRHALQTILTMSLWDSMKKQYGKFKSKESTNSSHATK